MFCAASRALARGSACPAMALRELKVCLLGVRAPRPALRRARRGPGAAGGREPAGGLPAKTPLSDGEPLGEPWRGAGRGGSSPRAKGGPRPAGSCRRCPLSGPVSLRRPGGQRGLPLAGGGVLRRDASLRLSARCFPWKKEEARTSRVRSAVRKLPQARSSGNKQTKPPEIRLGRGACAFLFRDVCRLWKRPERCRWWKKDRAN